MEEGPGLELRQENRGLKGFQGCDRDTWPEWQGPWRPWNCPGHRPRQSHQPGLQSCSHRSSPRIQCLGGVRPFPAVPLLRDSCPVSKGLFAERPPELKGQQPEPQPASCHQGPVTFADNKPWDRLRLERETQSKAQEPSWTHKAP